MLRLDDAFKLCQALNIPEELAYRYHQYNGYSHYILERINDFKKSKVMNPNLARALLKNSKFQSTAQAYEKVRFAILSQDLDLVRDALKDPKVDHDDMSWRFLMDALLKLNQTRDNTNLKDWNVSIV
jgi:hypothetical protein